MGPIEITSHTETRVPMRRMEEPEVAMPSHMLKAQDKSPTAKCFIMASSRISSWSVATCCACGWIPTGPLGREVGSWDQLNYSEALV